jgi:ribonucleoside-diphosphate reductase alpha chain
MLEQQESKAPHAPGDRSKRTQLEGIRLKVFLDRYSLKDANGRPLEQYPEELWARVARGIAAVEKTEELRAYWEKRFYEAMTDFKFVPGGRILAGAGSGHQVTFYNCLPPDQEVLTADGYRPIGELQVGDLVVTHRRRLRPIRHRFERQTEEPLYVIRPAGIGYAALRVTGEHKVYAIRSESLNPPASPDGPEPRAADWLPARELKAGDYLALGYNGEERSPAVISLQDYLLDAESAAATALAERGRRSTIPERLTLDGDLCYLFGRWLGDGDLTCQSGSGMPTGITLVFDQDEQQEAAAMVGLITAKFGIEPVIRPDSSGRRYNLHLEAAPLGRCFKALFGSYRYNRRLPGQLLQLPADLTLALLRGLFNAVGYLAGNELGVVLPQRTLAIQVHQLLLRLGYVFTVRQQEPSWGGQPAYRLQAPVGACAPLCAHFFGVQVPARSADQQAILEYDDLKWVRIEAIAVEDYAGPVLDIEVAEDHSFISGGVVISNCYVIPSPEDSRQGILDNLKIMTEIMARGGGVGINLSTLRPRGSYIRTVNGTASGPCSWAQLYSVATGDVIQQGGSRRGALMLMLDDTHPDIEEFITVKRTEGKIEHANLSVCISDRFMQAVKNDEPWELIWQGEVKKTVRARDLWNLICKSAWESAEPGVVFMDRCNKEANTWYYETIRCVNPCVTGATLVATADGYLPARDLQVGMNIRTPAGLKPIARVYNNGRQRIYRVDFSDGGYLEGTADHKLRVLHEGGERWVPISALMPGDRVAVTAHESFGARQRLPEEALRYSAAEQIKTADFYDRQLGLIVGTVLGTGALSTATAASGQEARCLITFDAPEDSWYQHFRHLLTAINVPTAPRLLEKEVAGSGGVALKQACVGLESATLAALLVRIGMTPALQERQQALPVAFLRLEKDFLAGVLDGLFSAAGSVRSAAEHATLRLQTVSPELAQQVRLILLQFGIHGHIERADREPGAAGYEVVVLHEDLARFQEEIGLSHPQKAAHLRELAANRPAPAAGRLARMAVVTAVHDTGRQEEVYDVYEPETLTWITNGYCSLDCGEQPLPPWGVCNLGALNLAAFVKDGEMDYQQLAETACVAMRFLDNVIDANEYFIEENREAQMGTRRTGLGTMGLADALIKMKVPYGSERSLPVIERIYRTIRDAAYDASADIAAEKGPFPRFDREKYMQGRFIQRLPRQIQEKIRKQGIRNAVLLTQAPTGTTSLFAGVSSGIEPVYDFAMVRRDRTGEHILYHPLFKAWRDEHPNEPTPDYFVAANDLTPEQHVRVQATIQKYTDASISKTVNAPNSHTVDDVKKLYTLAYELGCKGITYMRDGSRTGVLSHIEEKKPDQQKQQSPQQKSEAATSQQEAVIKPPPEVLHGYTRKIRAPEGKVNVTINSDEQGPLEVFVNVGKAGSDILALAEALGRLISLILRIPSPLSQVDRMREVAEQLRGIAGSRAVGFGIQQIRSLPDAVARALELHLEMLESGKAQAGQSQGGAVSHSEGDNNLRQEEEHPQLGYLNVTGNLCPQCGCNTMVYEEGCRKCYSCGYSEC